MIKNGEGENDYSETLTEYDWRNNPLKVLTSGTDTAYYYDPVGNVLRMYTGELTDFEITGLDNVTGAEAEVTKYAYDTQNRVVSVTDALGKTETTDYDINGNAVKVTDRNGNIINYTYDPLGNATERSSRSSEDAEKESVYTYTFNRMNLPLTMTGEGVTTTYTYNNIGQLLKEELTNGVIKEYNYDSNGNRTMFTLIKDGVQEMNTTYSYDKLDRLQSVTNGTNVSSYTYNKNGNLLTDTTDGYVTSYIYNKGGWVTGLTTAKDNTTIQTHSYSYYPDGNISEKQSIVGEETSQHSYEYDDAGRLVKEIIGENSTTYAYDPFGNRESLTNGGMTENYTYDLNNRLTKKVTTKNGINEQTSYTYDNNGNQLSWVKGVIHSKNGAESISLRGETDGEEYATFGYDPYNRLTYYTNGVTTASYSYDGNNQRQLKTVNGITTNHIWDGTDIVMDISGTINKYYRGLTGISYAEINGVVNYYHKNAHGDVTALTNSNGEIVNNYQFDAFGNRLTETETTNPFGYCGEYYDTETSMIYLRNRYYDPTSGRFITEDPVKDGVNWYGYCNGNPVMFVDPWGLAEIKNTLENQHDNTDVILRDMFNMYANNIDDYIKVFDDKIKVSLNGKQQQYYYDTKNNKSVDGNYMSNGRMMVDAVAFAERFELEKTVWTGGTMTKPFLIIDDIPRSRAATIKWSLGVTYVDAPVGKIITWRGYNCDMESWAPYVDEQPILSATNYITYLDKYGNVLKKDILFINTGATLEKQTSLDTWKRYSSRRHIVLPKMVTQAKVRFSVVLGINIYQKDDITVYLN